MDRADNQLGAAINGALAARIPTLAPSNAETAIGYVETLFPQNRVDRRRQLRSLNEDAVIQDFDTDIVARVEASLPALIKRMLDVIGATAALVVFAPVLLVAAVLVRGTSPGPIFFSQMRMTKGGKLFRMWKFRTMVTGAENLQAALADHNEMSGPVFKIKNDPRITRVGRVLRKSSIDELPQLFNVLLGDMSLVGPRPPIPAEVQKYRVWQARRLSVKTGITCLWQISGRNHIDFDNWMRLDLRYVETKSLWLDCKIMLKTVRVVLTGHGAS